MKIIGAAGGTCASNCVWGCCLRVVVGGGCGRKSLRLSLLACASSSVLSPAALATEAAADTVSEGGVPCWSLAPVGGDIVSKSVS